MSIMNRKIGDWVMKKVLFTMCVFIGFILAGCSTSPLSESEIQSDLVNHPIFSGTQSTEITSFNIIKRQTSESDKKDIIYISASSQNETFHRNAEYIMTYGLYNDGWILDNVEVSNESIIPLSGSSFDPDELAQFLEDLMGIELTNISVYSHETDLNNQTDQYSLTATSSHIFMAEQLDVTINFSFDPINGWVLAMPSYVLNASTSNWNITGEYMLYDMTSGTDSGKTCKINFFDQSVLEYVYTNENGDVFSRSTNLVNVKNMTPTEYYVNYGHIDLTDRDYHVMYGYDIAFDNIEWGNLSFAGPVKYSGIAVYIGKEHFH